MTRKTLIIQLAKLVIVKLLKASTIEKYWLRATIMA